MKMLREYKFIVKIREEGKLLNWFHETIYLLCLIEMNHYDFIEGKIWIEMNAYNEAIIKGIELGDIKF